MVFQIDQTVLLDFAVHAQGFPLATDDRIHDQTQLIDDPRTLKSTVEDAAAFQKKGFNAEVGVQLKKMRLDFQPSRPWGSNATT